MKIGLDLDGCVYNFADSVRYYLQNHCNETRELANPNSWCFYRDQWGYTQEEFDKIFAEGVDAEVIFMYGNPLFDAKKVTTDLRAAGHTIHIITYRVHGTKSEYNTARWLQYHGILYDSLTFSKDKSIVKLDFMIDDNLDFHRHALANGINCYLLDQPWNRYEEAHNRIFSVDQYIEIINGTNPV